MATNKSRKRATKFLPRDEVDWARAQRQAEQSAKHAAIPNSKFNPSGTGSRPHYAEKYPAPVPQSGHLAEATHDLHRQAQARRSVGRGLAVAGGAVAVAGGTGYLVHRHNQKQKELASKMLVDPFAKSYPIVEPVPRSIRVAALLPTGRHVGTANNLQHFKITPKGHRQGPFGKAFKPKMPKFVGRAAELSGSQAHNNTSRVHNGLAQMRNNRTSWNATMPLTGRIGQNVIAPTGSPTGSQVVGLGRHRPGQAKLSPTSPLRRNGNIPDGPSQGRRLA